MTIDRLEQIRRDAIEDCDSDRYNPHHPAIVDPEGHRVYDDAWHQRKAENEESEQ